MIKIIAAVSQNGIIGKKNELPFDYSENLKHFKNKTTGSVIIMGRKTFDGIKKPLPNRKNVVITSKQISNYSFDEVEIYSSLKDAINKYPSSWLIGGRRIYEEGMMYANSIHLTLTPDIINGHDDELVRFPWINPNIFYRYILSPFKTDKRLTECVFLRK